jgi:hypothetical protein
VTWLGSTTGKLTNTTKAVANFPSNGTWETSLSRLNTAGTELYTEDDFVGEGHWAGANYFVATTNTKTGALGPRTQFWSDDFFDGYFSTFSNPIIAKVYDPQYDLSTMSISPNHTNPTTPPAPSFTCTSTMLLVCGDQITVSIHPSNKYLFVADSTTNEVAILYVSATLKKLVASGASIPGLPWPGTFFSPDGLLVYAIEGSEILVYVFNPHSGLLTAKSTISAPGVGQILPVK